jgi:hypothetical protein
MSYALYRECGGAGELKSMTKADRRRIPDTTPCTKPLEETYGYWFPACAEIRGYEVRVVAPV